ncbi:MAG: hypothetical protein ABL951_04225 [Alphaproteobacteria bacterium]
MTYCQQECRSKTKPWQFAKRTACISECEDRVNALEDEGYKAQLEADAKEQETIADVVHVFMALIALVTVSYLWRQFKKSKAQTA